MGAVALRLALGLLLRYDNEQWVVMFEHQLLLLLNNINQYFLRHQFIFVNITSTPEKFTHTIVSGHWRRFK